MSGICKLIKTISDTNPGMVFERHERAMLPERAYKSGHVAMSPASPEAMQMLSSLGVEGLPEFMSIHELYRKHNGLRMYELPLVIVPKEFDQPGIQHAVVLYPIEQWEEATSPWLDEEVAWMMDDAPLYQCGRWRVIGGFTCEGMSIVMFFDGVYEGVSQAGMCYCIGLDGYLGFDEVLAVSFDDLAEKLSGQTILETINRTGFTWTVQDSSGNYYGDVVSDYIQGVNTHQSLVQ